MNSKENKILDTSVEEAKSQEPLNEPTFTPTEWSHLPFDPKHYDLIPGFISGGLADIIVEDIKPMLGSILTVVEAAGLQPSQEKAMKKMIQDAFYKAHEAIARKGQNMITKMEVTFLPEEINKIPSENSLYHQVRNRVSYAAPKE